MYEVEAFDFIGFGWLANILHFRRGVSLGDVWYLRAPYAGKH